MKLILGGALKLLKRVVTGTLSHALSGLFFIAIVGLLWFVGVKIAEYYALFDLWALFNKFVHFAPPAVILATILMVSSLAFSTVRKLMKFLTVRKIYGMKVIYRYDREGDVSSHEEYAVMGKKTYKGQVYLNCVQILHCAPPNGRQWSVREDEEGKRFEYSGETMMEYLKHTSIVYVGTYKVDG